ncbi:MAG: DUF1292 domain-containing protein [Oscillospiraceae bacterium]|nr:DUF1292 domain-containing protein [Oscillospiraceae bacterium]
MDEGIFISLTDDEGATFKLEVLGEVEFGEDVYGVFLPTDMDEDDPDYGFVILQVIDNGGEVEYASVDDEEKLQKVYAIYMEEVFADEEEEEEEE